MQSLIPFDFESKSVRTILRDGDPWFVATDICRILGLGNVAMAIRRLDPDEKGVNRIDTLRGPQKLTIVNESGLYTLIMRSDKPAARRFRKWVTSEVLPALRRTGRYAVTAPEPRRELTKAMRRAINMRAQTFARHAFEAIRADLAAQAAGVLSAGGRVHVTDLAPSALPGRGAAVAGLIEHSSAEKSLHGLWRGLEAARTAETAAESDFECDHYGAEAWRIEREIVDSRPSAPTDTLIQARVLRDILARGDKTTDGREADLANRVVGSLERMIN